MKIRILEDAHHRLSSGRSQAFRARTEVNVPKATAEALIARGVAKAKAKRKPSTGDT